MSVILSTLLGLLLFTFGLFFSSEIRPVSIVNGSYVLTLFSNAFHSFGFYPLIKQLDPEKITLWNFFSFGALALGISLALKKNGALTTFYSGILTGIVLLTYGLLFGIDTSTLWVIAWLPLIVYSLDSSNPLLLVATLVISYLTGGVVTLLLLPLLFPIILKSSEETQFGVALVTVLSLALLFLFPAPDIIPTYPNSAHLIPDDGVSGVVHPLVTDSPSLAVINREGVQSSLYSFALPLFIIILLLFLYCDSKEKKRALPLFLFAFFLTLDLFLPEKWALIAPLQTARRVIPGVFNISLSGIVLASLIILTPIVFRGKKVLLGAFTFLLFSFLYPSSSTVFGRLTNQQSANFVKQLLQGDKELVTRAISPSFYIYQHYDLLSREGRERSPEEKLIPLKRFKEVKIYSNGKLKKVAKKLRDKNLNTRFTASKGGQLGGETLCFEFEEAIEVSEIHLQTGRFGSDFPRGIEVFAGERCELIIASSENSEPLARYSPWEGPLRYNSEGYPFFGHQSEVEIETRTTLSRRAYLIRQTRSAPFDWSVAEVLIRSPHSFPEKTAPENPSLPEEPS